MMLSMPSCFCHCSPAPPFLLLLFLLQQPPPEPPCHHAGKGAACVYGSIEGDMSEQSISIDSSMGGFSSKHAHDWGVDGVCWDDDWMVG
jgi:hypothetical protein